MKEPVLPDFPPPPPGAPLHSHASDAPGSSHDSLDLPDPPLPPLPNKANPFLQKGIGGVPQEHPDEADIPLPPPPAEAIHKAQSADPAKSIDTNFNAHHENFLSDGIYQTYGMFSIICTCRKKIKPFFIKFFSFFKSEDMPCF